MRRDSLYHSILSVCLIFLVKSKKKKDFPGDLAVKNLPADARSRVQSLAREDPTCRGATKPMQHSYSRAWAPQAATTEAHRPTAYAPPGGRHCNETQALQPEQTCTQRRKPSTAQDKEISSKTKRQEKKLLPTKTLTS